MVVLTFFSIFAEKKTQINSFCLTFQCDVQVHLTETEDKEDSAQDLS